MKTITLRLLVAACLLVLGAAAINVQAQRVSLNYNYKLDLSNATEPPVLTGAPDINFPEEARKRGVEGTVKLKFTLSENGQVTDINVLQGLSNGVTEAVVAGVKTLYFKPAQNNGKPISVTMMLDYTVAMTFSAADPNVKKPVITDKPAAIYPESKRAEKVKGKVEVQILFNADGSLSVLGASSVLPKEFDKAALEAARNIKFQPAVHKKSKKPVAQTMVVDYDFKL